MGDMGYSGLLIEIKKFSWSWPWTIYLSTLQNKHNFPASLQLKQFGINSSVEAVIFT